MTIGRRYKFQGTTLSVQTGLGTAKPITAITNANPAVITSTAHGLSVGQSVYVAASDGMPEFTAGEYVVASVPTANTYTLVGVNSLTWSTFAIDSPNTNVANLVTFSQFCELTGYNQTDGTSDTIDATTICSTAKEFEVGLADSGTLSLDFNAAPNTPVQLALRAARASGSIIAVQIVFPKSGGRVLMFGAVQSMTLSGQNAGLHKSSASIKLSGDIVVLST